MAGFVLKNTLSDNGGVTRGICKMDEQNNLTEVVETKNIVKTADGAEADGVAVDVNSLVSMNMITIGVRPHKEKINISKEIINKTRGAVAPYAAQIFTHLSVVSSRQRSYDWLRCEGLKNEMEM